MKGEKLQKRKIIFLWSLLLLLLFPVSVNAAEQEEAFLEDLELQEMQEAVNELLGEDTFSLEGALGEIAKGEKSLSKDQIVGLLKEFLLSRLIWDKEIYVQIILLVVVAALFSNFTEVFGNGQTGEISFYLVYMLLAAILIHSFGTASQEVSGKLQELIVFMKALMPSYFLAVTASSGSATAMVFYEMVMGAAYVVQALLLKAVIPGIHAYVLIQIVNFLHREELLSRMAELLQTIVEWTLKTCTAAMIGMQLVQNMITPAVDSLKRDVIGKTAAAIPGVGNAIDGVTEVALATAVLIRNSLGVLGILILLLIGLPPILRLGIMTLLYKFLAAFLQPVSDKRMSGCLSAVGEGCRLLLKVLLMVELLLLITIAILAVSFIGN